MGLATDLLSLRNPCFPELSPVEIEALADAGVVHLCVPHHIAIQLRLAIYDHREVLLADGSRHVVPYMGPIEVRFKNRVALGGALVFGEEALLGAIPIEDMDVVVLPRSRRVDVNPESPNMAASIAK
jgi:clan AA aspartic protease